MRTGTFWNLNDLTLQELKDVQNWETEREMSTCRVKEVWGREEHEYRWCGRLSWIADSISHAGGAETWGEMTLLRQKKNRCCYELIKTNMLYLSSIHFFFYSYFQEKWCSRKSLALFCQAAKIGFYPFQINFVVCSLYWKKL